MRTARLVFWLVLLGVAGPALLAPAPVYADDDDDDEFETFHLGIKLGVWYRPRFDMKVQIAGEQPANPLFGLIGSDFDIHRELGVSDSVHTEYDLDFDQEAIPEVTLFFESDWISLYVWMVPTFEYRGEKTLFRDVVFGGQTFTASTIVRSSFKQFYGAADLAINIFNNRFFRISPMIGVQILGIDWEIEAPLNFVVGPFGVMEVLRADTSDIDSPASWEGFELFPNPEAGLKVAVGYREYIEVEATVLGAFINYRGIEGSVFRLEATVSVYPISWIGLQVGVRRTIYDIKAKDSKDPKTSFDFDLEYSGFTGSLIIRF